MLLLRILGIILICLGLIGLTFLKFSSSMSFTTKFKNLKANSLDCLFSGVVIFFLSFIDYILP